MKVRKNRYNRNCFGKVALCLQKWINRKDLPSSRFCSGQVSNTTGALAVLGWGGLDAFTTKISQNSPKMTQNCPNWPKNDPKLPKWPKNDPKGPKN